MGNNPKFNLNLRNHLIKGESAGERFEQAARSISSVSLISAKANKDRSNK